MLYFIILPCVFKFFINMKDVIVKQVRRFRGEFKVEFWGVETTEVCQKQPWLTLGNAENDRIEAEERPWSRRRSSASWFRLGHGGGLLFENTVTLAGDLAPIRYVTLRGNAPCRLHLVSPPPPADGERALRAVSVNCYVQTSLGLVHSAALVPV